jgi:hypothetical protein
VFARPRNFRWQAPVSGLCHIPGELAGNIRGDHERKTSLKETEDLALTF